MIRKALLPPPKRKKSPAGRRKKTILKLLENDLSQRVSYEEYREKVRDVYAGPQGALLATASLLSLHVHLGDRLLRTRKFDLRGAKAILDVGSGAGQIAKHLLKYADPDAGITCCDLSPEMLRRARTRLKNPHPSHVAADLSRLPFADASFDCITCGYVLEHLPEARPGLAELSRVLQPGGRMLLMTTEDNFSGAWTSRFWCCRTYNRRELYETSHRLGLVWKKELWFTRMHKLLRAGGICVEIEKR
jgi:ubiquinone/menaquinone biosynthesis C-methylase UbiE